jgi:hypothetical protein
MRGTGRTRGLSAALGIALASAILATPALAGSDTATPPVREPDSPFAAGCGVTDTAPTLGGVPNVNFSDTEVEPFIDVDRSSNQANQIAVFQQDRWTTGGAHSTIAVVSHNTGMSFSLPTGGQPGFDRCSGGLDFERASDPWISFAPNGDAYFAALVFDVTGPGFGGASAVAVSKSPASSHGDSWQTPAVLGFDASPTGTALNDKDSVTADPNTSNNVYAVWDRLVSPSEHAATRALIRSRTFSGRTWFARTTTAGASWEMARPIFNPGQGNQTLGNQIVVAPAHPSLSSVPGGVLIDGFDLITNKSIGSAKNASQSFSVAVIRSSDQGATWSGATVVSPFVVAPAVVASTGVPVRGGEDIPEFAVDRASGTAYAVWMDGRYTGKPQIALSLSKNGGASWSAPVRVNDTGSYGLQTFLPQVHVADDGTVGVSYYQLDGDTGSTTIHVVHCHAAADCSTVTGWNANGQATVGGPFNIATAPNAEGYFVGDYQGLTDFGSHGFRPFFIMATPSTTTAMTDAFSNTVCPATGC